MRLILVFAAFGAAVFGLMSVSLLQAVEPVSQVCGQQYCEQGAQLRSTYVSGSQNWPLAHIDEDIEFVELGALPRPNLDRDAPIIELGGLLFHDPVLSQSGQFACASCHVRELGFADGQRSSFGHDRQQGQRNAPSLLDRADQPNFMWDGSADSFAHQAVMPILNPIEMASDRDEVEARLNADAVYVERFQSIFGPQPITLDQVGEALAAFQTTLHRRSRFDGFMQGRHGLLSDQQIFGLHLFRTKARCANCHMGPRLTDDEFHNLGLHFYGRSRQDLGRYNVTGNPDDVGAFKTPSLRHVSQTAPYMHNGLVPHLRGVLNIYDEGGAHPRPVGALANDPLFPTTSERLHELDLTQEEKDALEAFLRAL